MSTMDAHLNEELGRTREALAATGCDFALLSSLTNVTYASGWEVPVPVGALTELAYGVPLLLLSTREPEAWLIVPNASVSRVEEQARVTHILPFETFDSFNQTDSRESFLAALRDALDQAGMTGASGTCAIEGRALPYAAAALVASELPNWTLNDAEAPLQQARLIKTEREINLLRRASVLADISHNNLAELCRDAGRTEFEMWAEISAQVFLAAGHDIPLSGELVTGPRTTTVLYPNGPRDRATEPGDAALMDLSGRIDGYWFDCTNTHIVGETEPTHEQRRYAHASRAACETAMDALRPGARASDAAAAAEAAFARFDLPMAHYAGHQIGVTVNENPRLVPYDHTVIEPGMVFCVEPGAYQGPGGSFGARSEKMVLVTSSGPEVLSTFAWGI